MLLTNNNSDSDSIRRILEVNNVSGDAKITIRCTEDLRDKFKQVCKANNLNASGLIRSFVLDVIRNYDQQQQ